MSYMSGSYCMSIIQYFQEIKKIQAINISIVSAYLKDELIGRFNKYDIANFFSKPLRVSDVESIISQIY